MKQPWFSMKTSGLRQKHKNSRLTTGACHLTTGRVSIIHDIQTKSLVFCPPKRGHFFMHQTRYSPPQLTPEILPQQKETGAFRLMAGGKTWRPDVERPRKTSVFNRGLTLPTVTSGRLAPLCKRSKRYTAKNDYCWHFMPDNNPGHLDGPRFVMWIQLWYLGSAFCGVLAV